MTTPGHRRFDIAVTYDLALDPLAVRSPGGIESGSSLHYLHFGAALEVLPRLLFESNLPIVLYQSGFLKLSDSLYLPGTGDAGRSPDLGTAGDWRLGFRWELPLHWPFRMAASVHSWAPSGDRKTLSGDAFWRGGVARAIAQLEGSEADAITYLITSYAGASVLHPREGEDNLRVGPDLGLAGGAVWHMPRNLESAITGEVAYAQGAPTKINDSAWSEIGVFLRLESRVYPWSVRAGYLHGLTEAPGVAENRVVMAFHFAPKQRSYGATARTTEPAELDHAGAPQGAGGFQFGQTPATAGGACTSAGLAWSSQSATRFACARAIEDVGLTGPVELEFCDGALCAIRFAASAEGASADEWRDHYQQLKGALTRRFGAPTRLEGAEPPVSCEAERAPCWSGSRAFIWAWPSKERVTYTLSALPHDANNANNANAAWQLRLTYESAKAKSPLLSEHDCQGL